MEANQHCGDTCVNTRHMVDWITMKPPLELINGALQFLPIQTQIQLIGITQPLLYERFQLAKMYPVQLVALKQVGVAVVVPLFLLVTNPLKRLINRATGQTGLVNTFKERFSLGILVRLVSQDPPGQCGGYVPILDNPLPVDEQVFHPSTLLMGV